MTEDDLRAELLALIASGRPERLMDLALATFPGASEPQVQAAARAELLSLTRALSSLALAEPEVLPSDKLRARIVATMEARAGIGKRPTKRALLVIDMLNDHLGEGRALEVPRAREIVPALQAHLDHARRDGIPVVYVCDEHERDDTDLDAWSAHNVRGSEGAQVWAPLTPKPGDRIVTKPTYSAFSRSELGNLLGDLGVDTLILTGCLTEIGVLATATDALQRGYVVEVPADAQAGATVETEQAAMLVLSLLTPYGPARCDLLSKLATSEATVTAQSQ